MKIFGLDPVTLMVSAFLLLLFPVAAMVIGVVLYCSAKKGDEARKTALAALVMGAASVVPGALFDFIGAIYGLVLGLIACVLARSCKRYDDHAAARFMANGAFVIAVVGLALNIFVLAKTGLFAMLFSFDGWFGPPS